MGEELRFDRIEAAVDVLRAIGRDYRINFFDTTSACPGQP